MSKKLETIKYDTVEIHNDIFWEVVNEREELYKLVEEFANWPTFMAADALAMHSMANKLLNKLSKPSKPERPNKLKGPNKPNKQKKGKK